MSGRAKKMLKKYLVGKVLRYLVRWVRNGYS